MNIRKAVVLVSVLAICVEGCRRQTPTSSDIIKSTDVDQGLSNFFSGCMFQKTKNVFPSWISVVDFILRDTRWFTASKEQFCRDKGNEDLASCWQSRLDKLIRPESEVLPYAKECVAEYSYQYDFHANRTKARSQTFEIEYCLGATEEEYNKCVNNEVLMPANILKYPSLRDYHHGSIEQFIKKHISNCRISTAYAHVTQAYLEDCPIHDSPKCISDVFKETVKTSTPIYTATTECVTKFSKKVGEFSEPMGSNKRCDFIVCTQKHQHCDGNIGSCICDDGYEFRSGECKVIPGITSTEQINMDRKNQISDTRTKCEKVTCIGNHQICDENIGVCVCENGYKYISGECQQDKEKYSTDYVLITYKCQRKICGKPYQHCDESNGECVCDIGYRNNSGHCQVVPKSRKEDKDILGGESFATLESILFTQYSEEDEKTYIQYIPAKPSNGNHMMKTLMQSIDGKPADYWGMVASYETGHIFFNDYKEACLHQYDVTNNKLNVIANDLTDGLENMEYDRVTNVLYWTDSVDKMIIAMEGSYRHFTKIYKSETVAPYGLALHVTRRKLYFSVYKLNNGFISDTKLIRCDLDGGNQETILKFPDVIRPRDIAIDYQTDSLYWTDVSMYGDSLVMTSKLDGTRLKELFKKENGYFWGIAISQEYLYITNTLNVTLNEYETYVRSKDGRIGSKLTTTTKPRHISVYASNSASNAKVKNECEQHNCEHICLASFSGKYTCKCSPGFQFKDGSKCVTKPLSNDYILVADIGQKRLFQLPLQDENKHNDDIRSVDVQTTEKVYATAVNPRNGELAWYDLEKEEIFWGHRILSFGEAVSSIAIHPCEEKIYWASLIGIYSWDGKRSFAVKTLYTSPVVRNTEIREIVIDYIRSHIYWTEDDAIFQKGRVMRSDLDGRNRQLVLDTTIVKGMAIDYKTNTLYVTSMVGGIIYSIQLNEVDNTPLDKNAYTITKLTPFLEEGTFLIFDIVIINGWVYLADSEASNIRRFNLEKGPSSLEKYGPSEFFFVPTLTFYSKDHFNTYIRNRCPAEEPSVSPIVTHSGKTSLDGDDCVEIQLNGEFSDYLDCMFKLLETIY